MDIIAVIPARGGSKRLPRKNIMPMAGKPLIVHTIEHAKKSSLINRVVVSTDGDEIASVSSQCGAEVIKRPNELSTDTVATIPVLLHVLDYVKVRENYSPDLIVFLQCTSPVRKQDDIDNAIKTLREQEADCVFSVCRFKDYVWRITDGAVESINFDYKTDWWRRQDFPLQFRSNGSIFVYKRAALEKSTTIFSKSPAIYEMDYLSSFQVDTYEDFQLCEYILELIPNT